MPKFREISGQFVGYIPDGTDPDIVPDRTPMNGKVTFTPVFTGGVIAFPELSPPEFARPEPIRARIVDGFVRVEVGVDETLTLQPLSLMVTVDDEATQVWSWRAEFSEILIGASDEYVTIPAWSFRVPDGTGPVDLTELVPLKSTGTVDVTKGPRGAGLENITAVDGQLVFAYTDGEETTVPIPEAVQGPQGEPGPAGADGEQGPEGPQGPAGEIPDLLVGNITDATPTGKNLMLAATEGAARNALGLQTGATTIAGAYSELKPGSTQTNSRVWSPKNLSDYVEERSGETLNDAKTYADEKKTETEAVVSENYVAQQMDKNQNVVVGRDAMAAATDLKARNNNAFGIGALKNAQRARYNDAFGLNALYSLNSGLSEPDSTFKATRNSAFGSNTQRFNTIGYNNVTMGRNSLQCNESGISNTLLGAGAAAGLAPIGLSGAIENQIPQNMSRNTGVGSDLLVNTMSNDNTAVGYSALRALVKGAGNTAVGSEALAYLEQGTFPGGGYKETLGWTEVSYTVQSSSALRVDRASSGFSVGDIVQLSFSGQEDQRYSVTAVDSSGFTIGTPSGNSAIPASGTCTVVARGRSSARNNNYNTAIGYRAGQYLDNVSEDGGATGSNTAVGAAALRTMEDGSNASFITNVTGLGAFSCATGSNQVVLGRAGTTPYAYSALQLRSDERDKADIRDTSLGLDFVNKLRPVDFKYDYRADYLVENEDGTVEAKERDGSRKRSRYHHGVIAQEVQEVIADTGVDFGGFQDHSVNGGSDVLTIGYEEFIAPLIKAVQELSAEVEALKARLAD